MADRSRARYRYPLQPIAPSFVSGFPRNWSAYGPSSHRCRLTRRSSESEFSWSSQHCLVLWSVTPCSSDGVTAVRAVPRPLPSDPDQPHGSGLCLRRCGDDWRVGGLRLRSTAWSLTLLLSRLTVTEAKRGLPLSKAREESREQSRGRPKWASDRTAQSPAPSAQLLARMTGHCPMGTYKLMVSESRVGSRGE
jgi:hypothetical protein